jgi:hypothetical protein
MNARTALIALRAAVGVVTYAAPGTAGKLFGLDPDANPQAPYLARLFAVRDFALAGGAHQAEGPARRLWLQAGLLCDAGDAAAGLLGRRDESLPLFTSIMLTTTALSGVALGLAALQEDN